MNDMTRWLSVVVLVLLQATTFDGCARTTNAGPAAASPAAPAPDLAAPAPNLAALSILPTASLRELMDAMVDPAADGLWDAVAVTATAAGVDRREPRTPEEWAAVRRHALTLIEAMNLVILPGRHAAPADSRPGLGELPPEKIELLIEQQRPLFTGFANSVRATAREALEAIDRKDVDALLKAGGDIDAACEACHVTFWYPNQP